MTKDYFQDIVPPSRDPRRPAPVRHIPVDEQGTIAGDSQGDERPRSIRDIPVSPRMRPRPLGDPSRVPHGRAWRAPRLLSWGAAALSVVVLATLVLVALRSTAVIVTPRTQTVVFDQSARFTAFPAAAAATGTLTYVIQSSTIEDSESVASSGTVHAEDKASGAVTVYNNYSASTVRLVKNTRFESSGGLIFRAPAEIIVPPKKGTTPGSVQVTLVADQAGEQYNVQAGRFTLPGLKSSPTEYANVYAESSGSFSGGFSGERPGVTQSDRDAAVATLRGRIETKARALAADFSTQTTVAFPDLIQIAYESLPDAADGSGARIQERARIQVPVFDASLFAHAVALSVSAEADAASVRLVGGDDFEAFPAAVFTAGTDPLQFTMSGGALLIWEVNEADLASALAGKGQDAFQGIVSAFPGIQSARARIEPFWSDTFPEDPSDIRITVEEPER
ncbi:MAG TPA: hypothetical protein VJL39_02225 [Candidatus Paceibacterota bacterium]